MKLTGFRIIAKRVLGNVLWPVATRFASRRFIGGEQGLILMFHYLGKPVLQGASEDLFLSTREFARILDFACSRLCPMEPDEFLAGLRLGNLPPAATLLTFDDCAEQTVKLALPELVKRNLKACFFANPGLIDQGRTLPSLELMALCALAPAGRYEIPLPEFGIVALTCESSRAAAFKQLWPVLARCPSRQQPDMLRSIRLSFGLAPDLPASVRLAGWEDLAHLHRSGMLVGNHTMFHSTVDADGLDQFSADVKEGYRVIEERFPSAKRVFCYPYGRKIDATRETAARLRDLGTDCAFVTQGGAAKLDESEMLNLRREEAAYSVGATKLAPALALLR